MSFDYKTKLEEYIKNNYIPEVKEKKSFFAYAMAEAVAEVSQKKRQLSDVVGQVGMTFSQRLFAFIDEKGLTNAEVYKRAGIDRKLFSKIQCDAGYRPSKKTALALCVALELNLDETKDLIARAGYALSPSSVFDLIIEFFIENEVYDFYTINNALYEHNEKTLT